MVRSANKKGSGLGKGLGALMGNAENVEEVIFAIKCITKTADDMDYTEFIRQTEQSALAVSVKINDLEDNMNLTRFTHTLTDRDMKRLNKYLTAYLYLKEKY